MQKKFFKSILSSMLALILIISCCAIPSSAAVALNKSSVTLTKGYATTIKVTGTTSTPKWSTGDKSIATVSSSGRVIGKGVGSTYIYAELSSTTLRCLVNVVGGKIVAGVNDFEIEKGKTAKINIICKGTHTISLQNANKNIARGTWNGAKFDGDVVPLTIKAVAAGTTSVKIYAKKYPDVYSIINITVKDSTASNTNTDTTKPTTKQQVVSQTNSVSIKTNETSTVEIYSNINQPLVVSASNSNVSTASISSLSPLNSYYKSSLSIKGLVSGTTTIRVAAKNDSSVYTDITVTVTGDQYYNITNLSPTKIMSTDQILSFTYSSKTYYILVPSNNDVAYSNSLIAAYTNTYEYYTVYSESPKSRATTDTIMPLNYNNSARYVLLPKDYDVVKYKTAVGSYTNTFEYYQIYNVSPAKTITTDTILTWTITQSGQTVKRYLLLPFNYDLTRSEKIQADDIAANSTSELYKVLDNAPTTIGTNDQVIIIYINNTLKYMVVPKNLTLVEIAKKNAAISVASGNKTFYYTWYSTVPTNIIATTEVLRTYSYNGANYYLVIKKSDTEQTVNSNIALANTGFQFTEPRA